jgi:hypothetical protein
MILKLCLFGFLYFNFWEEEQFMGWSLLIFYVEVVGGSDEDDE